MTTIKRIFLRNVQPFKTGLYVGALLLVGLVLWQIYAAGHQRTQILQALCGRGADVRDCEPIQELIRDNAEQTRQLTVQNTELKKNTELLVCFMQSHAIELPPGVRSNVDCQQVFDDFNSSPSSGPNGPAQNQSSPSERNQNNTNTNGGGENPGPGEGQDEPGVVNQALDELEQIVEDVEPKPNLLERAWNFLF